MVDIRLSIALFVDRKAVERSTNIDNWHYGLCQKKIEKQHLHAVWALDTKIISRAAILVPTLTRLIVLIASGSAIEGAHSISIYEVIIGKAWSFFKKQQLVELQNLYCCEIYDCCHGAWGWEVGIRMFSDLSANLAAIERLNNWPTCLAHDEWSYHKTPQAIWIHVGRPFLFLIFFLKCSVSKIKSICRKAGACWKRRGQCASRRAKKLFWGAL